MIRFSHDHYPNQNLPTYLADHLKHPATNISIKQHNNKIKKKLIVSILCVFPSPLCVSIFSLSLSHIKFLLFTIFSTEFLHFFHQSNHPFLNLSLVLDSSQLEEHRSTRSLKFPHIWKINTQGFNLSWSSPKIFILEVGTF